ncbi:formate dehydrogenase accessory sulfurtransferase FdhD [Vallitalea okinawensis]|uniref:formate dehydrogenase accessory sulfurtransferase FdhD n=1 Tax=Vallitalea okinawensis TaxID=2078660 RepID=UPI000CFBCDC7|nr:formate dehydrogenase accessory sulfurtransferase FdhD [Vallitalea okinawensis]
MKATKQYRIQQYHNGNLINTEDRIITEYILNIIINQKTFIELPCTPEFLKELTLGYMLSNELISSKTQIIGIEVDYKDGKAYVQLSEEFTINPIDKTVLNTTTIYYAPQQVIELMKIFDSKSQLFMETGGVHSCALCDQNKILIFREDIGRHNAVDKVIGKALLEDVNLQDKMILTSCRVSSGIIKKVAKWRIPILASRSAPTDRAIDMARELNMQLCGFVRGGRMNIYA